MTILDTINALAAEQAAIYCRLCREPDRSALLERLRRIQRELADLWDVRRSEQAGKYDGFEVMPNNGKAYRNGFLAWDRHTSKKQGG